MIKLENVMFGTVDVDDNKMMGQLLAVEIYVDFFSLLT